MRVFNVDLQSLKDVTNKNQSDGPKSHKKESDGIKHIPFQHEFLVQFCFEFVKEVCLIMQRFPTKQKRRVGLHLDLTVLIRWCWKTLLHDWKMMCSGYIFQSYLGCLVCLFLSMLENTMEQWPVVHGFCRYYYLQYHDSSFFVTFVGIVTPIMPSPPMGGCLKHKTLQAGLGLTKKGASLFSNSYLRIWCPSLQYWVLVTVPVTNSWRP